jgi:cytoskeletal protein CcmA (bactofilin family)
MAIGRISGPLLKANLVRDGVDLAFETDLLYLDVTNARIGINTASPDTDLEVNGTTKTVTLRVDNQLDIADLTFTGNTISSATNIIDFTVPVGEAVVYHSKLVVDDFEIQNNTISTVTANTPLIISANGTGTIELQSNTNVTGNLYVSGNIDVTGNITVRGNITLGDENTDAIEINARIQSNLVPLTDNFYNLGSADFRWKTIYAGTFITTAITLPELNIGNLTFSNNQISSTTGQNIVIDGNGTGGVQLGNFRIVDNNITNIVSNAITTIQQSGTGYFKIATTNGFVPPVGNNAQRPTAYAVPGMTRYNTESRALEIWDGFAWASPAGSSGAVSENDANDIAASYALILG